MQRTLRFQGYLALAQAATTRDVPVRGRLSDLAAEVGYADHAHLSRECLRLTGVTPRELLRGGTDRTPASRRPARPRRPGTPATCATSRTVAAPSRC